MRYAAVFLIGAAVTLTAAGAVFDRNSDESPIAGAEGCVWVHGKEAQTQKGDSSRSLVLSCVACHISGTVD